MNTIIIPSDIAATLRGHLFQCDLEQGAFLFADADYQQATLSLRVMDIYTIPAEGWEEQMQIYLQMKDSERAKIMRLAREKRLCAIDCHSHPHASEDVWFSPSDVAGITEFAKYAKWKLEGKPFAAMVWGETSVDAVIWQHDFETAQPVAAVKIEGRESQILTPTASWFHEPRGTHRFLPYE